MEKRYFIEIEGIVQGVGFRPFLHRQAKKYNFTGWCRNTGQGVEMEAQGTEENLESFLSDFKNPEVIPPLSVIENVEHKEVEPDKDETGFVINSSKVSGHDTLITPDLATCDDCTRELFDPKDRRYRYPFINCTNCGPRFTIIKDVPYDRPLTSMGPFKMCPDCEREYKDIEDRRYHAQPVACDDCGPHLEFINNSSIEVEGKDEIEKSIDLLSKGGILAIKGLGGFHLACLIDDKHVTELRKRKERNGKPFAIMAKSVEVVDSFLELNADEKRILTGPRKPIVLLQKKNKDDYSWLSKNDAVGVMLPYTPVHELLFDTDKYDFLVMTSANISESPVVYKNDEAFEKLKNIADGFLIHNREILRRCDDSLVSVIDGKELFYRRSRGYAPSPLYVKGDYSNILALGAEQKASFAFGKGKTVFYSQHIGDLKNMETFNHYSSQIEDFEKLFGLNPTTFVCDMHPDFLSSRHAKKLARSEENIVRVQHHHAHMASCMLDNRLDEKCIGVIFDGTGLGEDMTIWGSEILIGDFLSYERFGSIKPIALPGGDIVTEETDRVKASLLYSSGIDISKSYPNYKLMIEKKLNSPLSSGMGRLFDGVYSLVTDIDTSGYEGEAAILLECLASRNKEVEDSYTVEFVNDGIYRFDYSKMIKEIVKDKEKGVSKNIMAIKFHNSVVSYAIKMCSMAKDKTGINKVVLSGGSFFNRILTVKIKRKLSDLGFEVYTHSRVSPGDEGIAFGQLAVAKARSERGV